LLVLAKLLEAQLIPQRIEHGIEPKQRGSERHVFSQWATTRGVEPAFPGPEGRQNAIDYARDRFGGSRGEIHVYSDDGATIERKVIIDGRGQYSQSASD